MILMIFSKIYINEIYSKPEISNALTKINKTYNVGIVFNLYKYLFIYLYIYLYIYIFII